MLKCTAATPYTWQASQPVTSGSHMQGESHVLVMELCSTDLAAALERAQWRWHRPLIRALLQQLLQGIAACHQAGPTLLRSHQRGVFLAALPVRMRLCLLPACPT